ncbi:MAG: hypothetical protein ACJ72H_16500 [Candidatus Sulfotelmatobacter sp.]|jgi:hypothetical protein
MANAIRAYEGLSDAVSNPSPVYTIAQYAFEKGRVPSVGPFAADRCMRGLNSNFKIEL